MTPLPLQEKQDSAQFDESYEDSTIRGKTEGGYVSTRPRYTRAPSRLFTTGFTDLSDADKITLENYWLVNQGHGLVQYTHPVSSVVYTVRMTSPPIFKYVGMGSTRRWNCTGLTLRQV